MLSIVPIVEGQGDVAALPILLRRLLQETYQRYDVEVAKPKNAHGSGNLIKKFEGFLAYAATTPDCGSMKDLIDADDKCPVELAEELVTAVAEEFFHARVDDRDLATFANNDHGVRCRFEKAAKLRFAKVLREIP